MKEITIKLTKDCPVCDGSGREDTDCLDSGICPHGEDYRKDASMCHEYCPCICISCKGTGQTPNYMTPEEYERDVLNGEKLHKNSPVWIRDLKNLPFELFTYGGGYMDGDTCFVAIPGQPKPSPDYRHKESDL